MGGDTCAFGDALGQQPRGPRAREQTANARAARLQSQVPSERQLAPSIRRVVVASLNESDSEVGLRQLSTTLRSQRQQCPAEALHRFGVVPPAREVFAKAETCQRLQVPETPITRHLHCVQQRRLGGDVLGKQGEHRSEVQMSEYDVPYGTSPAGDFEASRIQSLSIRKAPKCHEHARLVRSGRRDCSHIIGPGSELSARPIEALCVVVVAQRIGDVTQVR